MNSIEQSIVKNVKSAWLEASTATKTEIEKLIVGERGFVRNNAWTLLVLNGLVCFGLGYLVHAIFG
jgi:hypothetical protein